MRQRKRWFKQNLLDGGIHLKGVSFSLNQYNEDGYATDNCVLLHIGNNVILRFENVIELRGFHQDLEKAIREIEATYHKI